MECCSTVARRIFSCYRRLAMRFVYTCRICSMLTLALTATVFSFAAQEDKCWSKEVDRGNRCEGTRPRSVSTPDLQLLSFVIGKEVVTFPSKEEEKDATLKVRFFLPTSGTVHIQAQELRPRRHYLMQAKQKHWQPGQWNEFFPWPLDVLRNEKITAKNFGITIQCGEDVNCLIPAVPYFSDRPQRVTSYKLDLRSAYDLEQVTYQLFTDDAVPKPLGVRQQVRGLISRNDPFPIYLQEVGQIPAGSVRLEVKGELNSKTVAYRVYRFYHTPEIQ